METFLHAVASVTIILLLTATGYFCAVKGWMTVQVKTFISRYLMTVGIPVMLIYGMQNNLTRADVLAAPRLLLIPLLVIPCCVVLSLLTGRLMKLPHRQLGVFVMMAAMGNTIFIGLAMCIELFGDIATPYVMLFYLVSSCFTQLIGIPLVRWSGEAGGFSMQMVWKFLRAPTVVSVFLSLLLVGLDIHLPSLVMSYAKYINNTVTPLALLRLSDAAADDGVRLALEFMAVPGSSVQTFAQCAEILEAVDRANVGMLLDTWPAARDRRSCRLCAATGSLWSMSATARRAPRSRRSARRATGPARATLPWRSCCGASGRPATTAPAPSRSWTRMCSPCRRGMLSAARRRR